MSAELHTENPMRVNGVTRWCPGVGSPPGSGPFPSRWWWETAGTALWQEGGGAKLGSPETLRGLLGSVTKQ